MTCSTQSHESWKHLQETTKNTSLPSLFDPLTLALSILILFYLSVFFLFKKHTHLTLYQLHIYSLTASFSWKTNTSFLFSILSTCFFKKNTRFIFSIFYLLVFFKKINKNCYVYCVRLTKACHSTCMFVALLLVLIASIVLICKSLWIKVSKWLNVNVVRSIYIWTQAQFLLFLAVDQNIFK